MGGWKDILYDMSRGMSRQKAEKINAILRNPTSTLMEKTKAEMEGELDIICNRMP